MSLPVQTQTERSQTVDWARLIPGETPPIRHGWKKPVQSVRPAPENICEMTAEVSIRQATSVWTMLIPGPLHSRRAQRWLRSTAADFALVALNWLLIGAVLVPLRNLFPWVHLFAYDAGRPFALLGIAVLHASLITLVGHTEGLLSSNVDLCEQASILSKSVLLATTVMFVAYGLQSASWTTGGLFCGAGLLNFGSLLAWRWQSARQAKRAKAGTDLRRVLIVGAGTTGRRVATHVEEHPEEGRTVCGFLDNELPLVEGIIGRVNDLARLSRMGFVDEVILAAPHDRSLTVQVVREARRLRLDVEIVPDLFGCKPVNADFERVGDLPVIPLHAERLPAAGLVVKRVLDVVGAALALIVASPLLAFVALLIKLDSRGPVLYSAPRVGRKGRSFRCYKFRTMVSDADRIKDSLRQNNQRAGPFFKMANDPRITRVGRWLRRFSLDELPQLLNVLKGDMSLVGPRPHPLDDVAGYEIEHLSRLDVTPGITGLWQVTMRRDPSFERAMELDREYIRTWSLGSDLRILLRTVLAVVRGSGE